MRYSVIIPAAGSGSRMGADVPKVLLPLNEGGDSILRKTVSVFQRDPSCERIVVCVSSEWLNQFEGELGEMSKVLLTPGGATRQESVRLGVEALGVDLAARELRTEDVLVLVHDAARCCVTQDVISRVVEGVAQEGAVAAAIPVPDSLSRVSGKELVGTVDRENVWAIQTPQGFLFDDLRSAHYAAQVDGFVALDDASVVARLRPVSVVEGDRLNIKVTHPADLQVARRILGME